MRCDWLRDCGTASRLSRLNPANGILLAAHLDALFDSGLISFTDDGTMLVSSEVTNELKQFQLPDSLRLEADER